MTIFRSKGWMIALLTLISVGIAQAQARELPDFTGLVEEAGVAVVNISTTQKITSGGMQLPEGMEIPDLPEGSPFGDLFKLYG